MLSDGRQPLRDSEETIQTKSMPDNRIDILPDDILLEIFSFHIIMNPSLSGGKLAEEVWQPLVHVCRRWRNLVFGSPRRLNLRLCCSPKTPARETLDVWPAFPLMIKGDMALSGTGTDIIEALGHRNRIHVVYLWGLAGWQLEQIVAAMQVPFSELTELRLYSNWETMPVIPDSFLGGSAPRLQSLYLVGVLFPGLPKLLSSATQLVELSLTNTPHSGYISPEAIVAPLSALSSLKMVSLQFESPQSHPDWQARRRPPSKRFILPSLDGFHFKGVTEYLEELVAYIVTPQLNHLFITLFNQIDFDCPRLAQFINRTPTLMTLNDARVEFDAQRSSVDLRYRTKSSFRGILLTILCREPDWQVSSIEQVCNSLPPVSTVEDLCIDCRYVPQVWKNDAIEDTQWWQLLLPFYKVKNLYLSREFAPHIAAALRELDGRGINVVLPNLQNILVEGLDRAGPLQDNIGHFVAARKLSDSDHPITISVWSKTPTW